MALFKYRFASKRDTGQEICCGRCISESEIDEEQIEDYIVRWVR